jgi:hypothetical protein
VEESAQWLMPAILHFLPESAVQRFRPGNLPIERQRAATQLACQGQVF